MSTYSSTLRLELIGNGQQDGTWGDTTNLNLGTLLESAITNAVDITFANATYTLSANNGLPDESRNAILNLIGTNSGAQDLLAPEVEKTYVVKNSTGATVTIKTTNVSSTGVAIINGATQAVWSDGTNFYPVSIPYNGASTGTGSLVYSISPTLTGTPAAPTANSGTNTTQIATTAFVTTALSGLGTMSTQNANNVSITGGTITGNYGLNSGGIYNSGGWSVTPSGTKIYFSYNGVNKASLDSSGNFIAVGNVTANGTP